MTVCLRATCFQSPGHVNNLHKFLQSAQLMPCSTHCLVYTLPMYYSTFYVSVFTYRALCSYTLRLYPFTLS